MRRRDRGTAGVRALPWAALVALPLALAGCSGNGQNALHPHSHAARDIASLFWWMTGGAFLGLGLIVGLLVLSWVRRGRRGVPSDPNDPKPGEGFAVKVVVALGVVVPILVMTAIFTIGDVFVMKTTAAPYSRTRTTLTVQAVGVQWYWKFLYPGTRAVTADELHIPVRTPVNLVATTADVIHSFSVPELNRKIDTIPGTKNRIVLYADEVGVYRGRCAEFCGLQHAHMAMTVYVDPPARFRAWLRAQSAPARTPTTALQRRGERVFLDGPCSSCHTIRGTSARGYLGPDLTHLASRRTLAGATIPNRKGYLAGWIMDSQHVKPGNQMPDMDLSGPQLQALLAYLESLK
ncbi:MAG TPA: cytochrome c oxidase subunit II [Gaiellaceae bacterium]|nr:cytochrome c oxidase subunit II [Gaiellaceae bacterium]